MGQRVKLKKNRNGVKGYATKSNGTKKKVKVKRKK